MNPVEYIVLLLGSSDNPMPSAQHLQKEAFILSLTAPEICQLFDFKRHRSGPYSSVVRESFDGQAHREGAFKLDSLQRVRLTSHGKDRYDELTRRHKGDKKFSDLLIVLSLIRTLYDKISEDELLFLVGHTYPDFVDAAGRTISNFQKRRLAHALKDRDMITPERYGELMGEL